MDTFEADPAVDLRPPLPGRRVLVTGAAGFVGYHVARRLCADGWIVHGIDNFNPYYDVRLKHQRARRLASLPQFVMHHASIADRPAYEAAWLAARPDVVIHLAAQAGVRYSIDHPDDYIASNLVGSFNTFELARFHRVEHLVIASTSSVYGANPATPFRETDRAVHPVSLYAATKGGMELMGHAYSHLYAIPMTFFRFFTVYGPWGRPDMAPMLFASAIREHRPIQVFNNGQMERDFTFIDDLVESVVRLCGAVPGDQPVHENDTLSPVAPCRTVNVAGGKPVRLLDFIAGLEGALGGKAIQVPAAMQPGDMMRTEADTRLLQSLVGTVPETRLDQGLAAFAGWFRDWSYETA